MNESLKNEDAKSSLVCDNARAGDDFVGLKYEDHKLNISFPMGYRYTKNKDELDFEKKKPERNSKFDCGPFFIWKEKTRLI